MKLTYATNINCYFSVKGKANNVLERYKAFDVQNVLKLNLGFLPNECFAETFFYADFGLGPDRPAVSRSPTSMSMFS